MTARTMPNVTADTSAARVLLQPTRKRRELCEFVVADYDMAKHVETAKSDSSEFETKALTAGVR